MYKNQKCDHCGTKEASISIGYLGCTSLCVDCHENLECRKQKYCKCGSKSNNHFGVHGWLCLACEKTVLKTDEAKRSAEIDHFLSCDASFNEGGAY